VPKVIENSARWFTGNQITEQNHKANMMHFVAQKLIFWTINYIGTLYLSIIQHV
jgi:hypothetical protein